MISEPTPVTISIIITLSGSFRSVSPKWYGPAESQVQAVVVEPRCFGDSERSFAKTTIAAANAPIVVSVETYAAPRREMRAPAAVIATHPANGRPRQNQAAAF